MTLENLGWNDQLRNYWEANPLYPNGQLGRIYRLNRNHAWVVSDNQTSQAIIPSQSVSLECYPCVGDWCVLADQPGNTSAGRMVSILTRRNQLRRKRAGRKAEAQVLAANVDEVFVLTSRIKEFSWNRLERYLTMIRNEQITPVICLTKTDLDPDPPATERLLASRFDGVQVVSISNVTGFGIEALRQQLASPGTRILVGSSGVGKSTLTNQVLNSECRATRTVRDADARGRHTTSGSEMFQLSPSGWLIDSPGLRELEPWDAGNGLTDTFTEIMALTKRCRFRNCHHDSEPGCAVQAALEDGRLEAGTLANFQKLQREQARQETKASRDSETRRRQRDKFHAKLLRRTLKDKGR